MLFTAKLTPLINFGSKFYYSGFLIGSNLVPSDCAIIQSFKYSVFHRTFLKPPGHGAIFTSNCNNLLKTCFCCCHARKLPHVPKPYLVNFYRALKKSNNYVATMLISVILMPFEL